MRDVDHRLHTRRGTEINLSTNTLPQLSAAAVERILQGIIDGLSVATIPFVATYIPSSRENLEAPERGSRGVLGKFQRPQYTSQTLNGVLLDLPHTHISYFPAGQATAAVRSNVIRLNRISYANPIEIGASLAAGDPNSVAKALQTLLTVRSTRRSMAAKATREELEAIADEALFDATIDEKFYLKERARVDLDISEQKLAQERLKTLGAAIQLARDLVAARDELRSLGINVPFEAELAEVSALLDNARLVESFKLLDALDLEIRTSAEEG